MSRLESWLVFVKHDIETPDLWDELRRQTELLSGSSDDSLENTPFTSDEQDDVAKQLNELREYWQGAYALTESQQADLDSKIDYLIDATTRLGRKDWLNACIGTVIGWVVVTALPPDASRHVLGMLLSAIAHFFGHHLPGLGSG
jgi:signal transduction histidine kinase